MMLRLAASVATIADGSARSMPRDRNWSVHDCARRGCAAGRSSNAASAREYPQFSAAFEVALGSLSAHERAFTLPAMRAWSRPCVPPPRDGHNEATERWTNLWREI